MQRPQVLFLIKEIDSACPSEIQSSQINKIIKKWKQKAEGWWAARSGLGYLPLWRRMPRTKARLGREPSPGSLSTTRSQSRGERPRVQGACAWPQVGEKSVAEVSPKKAENDFKCPTPSGLNIDVISTGKICQPQMPRRKEPFTKMPLSTTTTWKSA